jgi:DNA modification methylase
MSEWEVKQTDALEGLRQLEAGSVDCCVTSPPYWGLRDYGVDGQLGLEPHPSLYLEKLWAIFDEVFRVLKPSGTCWCNLGDTFGRDPGKGVNNGSGKELAWLGEGRTVVGELDGTWLRPKQLLLIPSRFAIGMCERGWLLRSDVIWSKPNAMPSSVTDRFSCTYEHVFLFVKQGRYWFDLDSVMEELAPGSLERDKYPYRTAGIGQFQVPHEKREGQDGGPMCNPAGKNPGDVWRIPTQPFPGAHFAVWPEALAKRMIRSGCPPLVCAECGKPWGREVERVRAVASPRNNPDLSSLRKGICPNCGGPVTHTPAATRPGLVLDPFTGSGTTGLVAVEEGRRFLGFDLSAEYCEMARRRIGAAQPCLEMA